MKNILKSAAALAMVLALGACGASTQSDSKYIEDKGTLAIGMTLFAPMNYMEGDELVGFETEFAKAVCDKLGVEADFQEINWKSKETELNSKTIDCIWNGMTITDDLKANMSITKPYMNNSQVLVTKSENAQNYSQSIDGISVVAESGSAGEILATSDEYFANADFTAVDSQAKALMDVAAGTSDAAVVDYVTSIGSIGDGTDFTDLVVVPEREFSPEQYGIAFRKDSDMTEKVEAAIDELKADGTLKKIADKYKLGDLLAD